MKKSHLTNQLMTELLRDLQAFWRRWRDAEVETEDQWNEVIEEANAIHRRIGAGSEDLIWAFVDQVHRRNFEIEEVPDDGV